VSVEHLDILIVGAGLSGIGAAHHLQAAHPDKSYALFEARDAIGGTWDLFRYPGVRSDSDMQTLGYRFRPWTGAKAIADGPSIRSYVRDTAGDAGIDAKIRFNHRIERAAWSSAEARYTVTARRTDTGETVEVTCGFLFVCSGYYRYDEGFTPHFEGSERFGGQIVHPQFWPEQLDCTGRRVVVVGSGATAITLVPALTDKAAHVTMLQRSPSYVLSIPSEDPIANTLRRVLPERLAYAITRWKNVAVTSAIYQLSRRRPALVKKLIRKAQVAQLPDGYAVDTHFKPRYQPWDERLCIVPDGDLFRVIRDGRASIVTDRIASFTETGLRLQSGAELEADIVITATGLNLVAFGGIALEVDGREVVLSDAMAYKGLMLSDVPNFAFVVGYTNASWTLKADLVSEYVCRLLAYMDEHGFAQAMPVNDDPAITTRPLLDFAAGYVQRSLDAFPKQGSKAPWRLGMNYAQDVVTLRHGKLDDGTLRFSSAPAPAALSARRP
jgi:cation diffusion facilitator CzcD-associated flavoprotein CzcO